MGRARLEAFSDGVLAVAITLLVLDLHASPDDPGSLWHQVTKHWPSYAAFLLSFFTIGVIWVNHHALFSLVERVDRSLMFYNLLLLLSVTALPFTTSVLADYLRVGGADARVAVVGYGIATEGMAVSIALILRHILMANLTPVPVSEADGKAAVRRFGLGTAVYPLIIVVGLFSAPAMFVLYVLLTGYYIFEQTPLLPSVTRAED